MEFSVTRVDHIVINCRDVETTAHWYAQVLGMHRTTYQKGRIGLLFGDQKLNLRPTGTVDWQTATVDAPGSLDLCFITDHNPQHIEEHLTSIGVTIVDGPVQRHGARGAMTSYYCFDPDGNAIEIASYTATSE